jgi:hypothetical protein
MTTTVRITSRGSSMHVVVYQCDYICLPFMYVYVSTEGRGYACPGILLMPLVVIPD